MTKHKHPWNKALKGQEYNPDAFDEAVEWLDDAYIFVKMIVESRKVPAGYRELAEILLKKYESFTG